MVQSTIQVRVGETAQKAAEMAQRERDEELLMMKPPLRLLTMNEPEAPQQVALLAELKDPPERTPRPS